MPQIIQTKEYGPINVEQSWHNGTIHIAKLVGGGFVHMTGLPVQTQRELREAIPAGKDLDEALNWFEHKDEAPEVPVKRIIIHADGTPTFDDGSPVETVADVAKYMAPGPFQDAAMQYVAQREVERKEQERLAKSKAGAIGQSQKGRPMAKAPGSDHDTAQAVTA
jgi:hypothetical protein